MIAPPLRGRVLVATRPVDFRRGLNGLAALVQEGLRQDPVAGDVFIFRSKRAERLKIVLWDGTGLVLVAKRLERGAFRWPPVSDGTIRLSAAQFAALWDGLEWSRLPVPPSVPRPRATQ
jgi:transposase